MTTSNKKRHDNNTKGREFPVRGDEQVYARVTKMLGNGRLLATGTDGTERMCTIRGSMRKREWVRVGDTVLLALREFGDQRADVVFRYSDLEVQRLRKLGEDVAVRDAESEEDDVVEFEAQEEEIEWDAI